MLSKYMQDRLAKTPFREPPDSQITLAGEMLFDLDNARQNTLSTTKEECLHWCKQAEYALEKAQTPEAKKYVWRQFVDAQDADNEPLLFMEATQWLLRNKEWSPLRSPNFLRWENDKSFQLESLLAATAQLPEPNAVNYLSTWLVKQQDALDGNPPMPLQLPVEKIRMTPGQDGDSFYDESSLGYTNRILLEHVVLALYPHLDPANKAMRRVPYLPFAFDYSFFDGLLKQSPVEMRPWMFSNALSAGDIATAQAHVVEREHTMQDLSTFSLRIEEPAHRAFVAWDLVRRLAEHRDDDRDAHARRLLKTHAPDLHALLEPLGALDYHSVCHALHERWSGSDSSLSLNLPEGLDMAPL